MHNRSHIVKSLLSAALVSGLAIGIGSAFGAPGEAGSHPPRSADFSDAPANFIPPPLHPEGVTLRSERLGQGVFAILSDHPVVDNAGFIVGDRGVLVIDSHISDAMAQQILALVRDETDKPIVYLVNTNYHGDHTFGNASFPAKTTIIAQRATGELMRSFEHEKEFMLATVDNDSSVFGDVRLRLPSITFEDRLDIDLGNRTVQIRHFGAGNTAGDTVVFEPETGTAWTGNLVLGRGTIPPVFEGRTGEYLATVSRLASEINVSRIIPGHGAPAGREQLGVTMAYLSDLLGTVGSAIDEGKSLEQALRDAPTPTQVAKAPEALRPFLLGLHANNIATTYRDLAERR